MIRLVDDATQYDMVFFYNPAAKRYQGFLRYPRGHPWYPWFITMVYEFRVCATVTFESRGQRDPTKNIALEARACVIVREEDFRRFKTDEEFLRFLETVEDDAVELAAKCIRELFGITQYEIAGVTYHFICTKRNPPLAVEIVKDVGGCAEPDEYCSMARVTQEGEVVKVKDYTEEWERVR